MQLTAYLLAFGDEIEIRLIDIPDAAFAAAVEEDHARQEEVLPPSVAPAPAHMSVLELAFYYGQNDFQPKPIRSLSVGDVVDLNDGIKYRVRGAGWERLAADVNIEDLERGLDCSILPMMPPAVSA